MTFDATEKKRLRISFLPSHNPENQYCARMMELLSTFGTVVGDDQVLGQNRGDRVDLLVLNWTDNYFLDIHGGIRWRGVVREFLKLLKYRMAARRVVFVRHNMFPHKTAPALQGRVRRLVDLYERMCSGSWVHSGHMETAKRRYIPHPLYPMPAETSNRRTDLPPKFYAVFGRIVPYKRIENLLEVWPADLSLVICGPAGDREYLEMLRKMAPASVQFIPEFLSNEDAAEILRRSSGLVICNADEDMIASGSMVFALSAGVRVLALRTQFTRWFREHVNLQVIFDTDDVQQLVSALRHPATQPGAEDFARARQEFSDGACRERIAGSLQALHLEHP